MLYFQGEWHFESDTCLDPVCVYDYLLIFPLKLLDDSIYLKLIDVATEMVFNAFSAQKKSEKQGYTWGEEVM